MTRVVRVFSTLALMLSAFSLLHAQSSTATVNGTVRDQTGAVIPGATVQLINTGTSITSRTTTNQAGYYVFPGVNPGPYRISVESAGMQTFVATLTVQVRQSAVVDPVLQPAATATTVDVPDVTPMVTTDNPTLGHVLERQRIEQLPINGRFITSLLVTVPGMEGSRAYGAREGSQEFVLDGAALSDRNTGGNVRRPPGLDTIQEFKVENNNSSAKFNRPTTVIMSTKSGTNQLHGSLFETHRNNAIGKARAREDNYEKPPQLIRNEFGASAGGPVILPKLYNGSNRTFWFAAYEGFRNIAPTTEGFRVPTAAMRNGDFSALVDEQGRQFRIHDPWTTDPQTWQRQQFSYQGRPNVIDPARISPLAKYLYEITPLPTHPEINPLVAENWWGPVANTGRQWTFTTRFDHRFSDSDQVYARYTQGDFYSFADFGSLPALNNVASTRTTLAPNRSLALSWVHSFSPTLFNELVVSGSREKWWTGTGEPGVKYADQLGLPNPLNVTGWPGIYDTGFDDFYYETENTQAAPFTYVILDNNMTKVYGKHQFEFGFHHRYDQLNAMPEQQHNQGNHNFGTEATSLYDSATSRTNPLPTQFTGHDAANMFLGLANYSNRFVRGSYYMRGREYALYFQDNYKVAPRLTLNLGLRWEYWPAFREKNNVLTTFDPEKRAIILGTDLDTMYRLGATIPSIVSRIESLGGKFLTYEEAGRSQSLMQSTPNNFGPRLGFAYRAGSGSSEFVIRGGYRMSYFPIPLRPWTARMRANAPLSTRFRTSLTDAALSPDGIRNYGMRSIPTVVAGLNSQNEVTLADANAITRGGVDVSYFAENQPDPRIQDWNFTLEKEVFANTVARVAYVGNHGSNLEQYHTYNDPAPDYVWFASTGLPLPTGEFSGVARRGYDQQVYGRVEEYRKTGRSNYNGMQLELERRYSRGVAFQIFYVLSNAFGAGGQGFGGTSVVRDPSQYMPGAVPTDFDERNRLLSYQRDIAIPKHRLRWNWIVDLPFGKGKRFAPGAGPVLNRLIGGWQIAGIGQLRSNYFALPTDVFPNGNEIEIYGEKYPIQDCRSGACRSGYLWWNGYIPAHQINSVDANGRPNGVMGVPANYKPAAEPLIPWPAAPNRSDPNYAFYGTNTVFVPLKNGALQRTTYNDNLHPWRQQYFPGPRQWGLDASLFKTVPITETVNLRFNADFFNVLNIAGNPNITGGNFMLSTVTSGQSARELQLTLRLSW
ncbi:MAG: TonB-dependent receptor [Bryobacteraceae bacterium]